MENTPPILVLLRSGLQRLVPPLDPGVGHRRNGWREIGTNRASRQGDEQRRDENASQRNAGNCPLSDFVEHPPSYWLTPGANAPSQSPVVATHDLAAQQQT